MQRCYDKLIIIIAAVTIMLNGCSFASPKQEFSYEKSVEALSDPALMGRLTGKAGNLKAQALIEAQFKKTGLEPLFPSGYLQEYNQTYYPPDQQKISLSVHLVDGTAKELIYGQDFMEQRMQLNTETNGSITYDWNQADVHNQIVVVESREQLTDALNSEPLAVLIQTEVFMKRLPAKSVDIPGSQAPDHRHAIVISAHFDHVGWSGKANEQTIYRGSVDNASGVSALLQLASMLSEAKAMQSDVIFAAFNGEESGMLGSKAFVKQLEDDYDHVYNINLDCLGIADGGRLLLVSNEANSLVTGLQDYFMKLGIDSTTDGSYGDSDHLSFAAAGFPAVTLSQENISVIHRRVYCAND